jgi:hypothetical protein
MIFPSDHDGPQEDVRRTTGGPMIFPSDHDGPQEDVRRTTSRYLRGCPPVKMSLKCQEVDELRIRLSPVKKLAGSKLRCQTSNYQTQNPKTPK